MKHERILAGSMVCMMTLPIMAERIVYDFETGDLQGWKVTQGAFANLDLRHTRGDVVRAVMEGVAFGLKRALDELARLAPVADPLTLVGGGANSSLWRQIYADVYGRRVARAAIGQQAAALGAALVAGVGAGAWSDFSILDSVSRADAEAAPDPEAVADYVRRHANWRLLADKLGEWAQMSSSARNAT